MATEGSGSNGIQPSPGVPRGHVRHRPSVFERLAQNMEDITGDRGVLKEVIRAGSGEKVPSDATVILKFSGYLEHSDMPFETNRFRRFPQLMKLGEDVTLIGMELSVLSMQRGELSRFLYSPSYAYGTMGCPPLIPPAATVLFEIEMLDFLDTAESDDFCNLSLASLCLLRQVSTEEEKKQLDAACLLVNLNLALTYLKLERPPKALIWGEKALAIDNQNAKALFRCGQASLELREYEKARTFLLRAQRVEPFNLEINSELKRLASYYKEYKEQQVEICVRMFAPKSSMAAKH
ncbi:inactive peptidyl-prolyl cis-trans isomerase FKBP6 isoform X2 [Dendropsophus ebraccatus]|uniref:inactive peptidyl-prolyl cis-trans isomerase FKBP6 isoform X2 n=1 Tax=Dendropsophus ebraccatus TaxID=150705 RepID=UPI00383120A3